MARKPTRDLLNTLAGTSNKTTLECLNTLAGTTGKTRNEAWNTYAGTTEKVAQYCANIKAHTNTSFITPPTTALRNDFTGAVGFTFTVSQSIKVNRLGRLYVAGNVQDHVIKLWISTDTVTPLASGTILAAGKSDIKNFKWVDITPVTLTPGNTYAIGIDNTNGGDTFKDLWIPGAAADSRITVITTAYITSLGLYPNSTAGAGMFDTGALGIEGTPKLVQECVHIMAGETY